MKAHWYRLYDCLDRPQLKAFDLQQTNEIYHRNCVDHVASRFPLQLLQKFHIRMSMDRITWLWRRTYLLEWEKWLLPVESRARIFLFFIKLLRNLEWVISCLAMQMQKKRRSKKWSALSRQWQKLVSALSPLQVLAITSLLRQFFGHIDRITIIRKFCSPKDSLVSFYKN